MKTATLLRPSKSLLRKKISKKVCFEHYAPEAQSVSVAASFNGWDPASTPLVKDKKGKWKLKLTLSLGRYEYRYYVDGNWQNDQRADVECVPNAFGTWNGVLVVS